MNQTFSPDGPHEPPVLLVGHGTRHEEGRQEFRQTAELLRQLWPNRLIADCFLELAEPTIPEALGTLAQAGHRQATVAPLLLFSAGHAKEDIPDEVAEATAACGIEQTRQSLPLEWTPPLLELSALRFRECWQAADWPNPAELASNGQPVHWVLVGRGSRDPLAKANLLRFAMRRTPLTPGMQVTLSFCAIAEPRLEQVLDDLLAEQAGRVIIQPHFLFAGLLPDRVHQTASEYAQRAQADFGGQWLVTHRLGPDPLLAQAIAVRIEECEAAAASSSR